MTTEERQRTSPVGQLIDRIQDSSRQRYARAYAVWMVERGREPRTRDFGIRDSVATATIRGRLWQLYRDGEESLR